MDAPGTPRTYRFSITVTVMPVEEGYDDPEWLADAAWGALANIYGYDCTYGEIMEVSEPSGDEGR